jgi:nitrogen PTS system EIIA component
MNITQFLSPVDVTIDVAAADKQKLLLALARKVGTSLDLLPEQVFAELQKREELGSTGVGGGVALPHARFRHLAKPTGMLFRLRKAIDFDAVDARPVDIVFLLLLPEDDKGDHLGALASIARKLRKPEVAAALREAPDCAQIFRTLAAD